jgi:hypothetical protein
MAPAASAPRAAAAKPAPPADDRAGITDAADEAPPAGKAAAGGSFQDKLKKVPMWGWIVGGAAVLFLMCGCCGGPIGYVGWTMMGGGGVTLANFDKIKMGATETEVTALMGAPTERQTPDDIFKALGSKPPKGAPEIKALIWKGSGDDLITVTFSKDKVVAKSCKIGGTTRIEGNPAGM